MTITVNGQHRDIAEGTTLADFLEMELRSIRGTAAAIDGEIVPRAQWPQFQLASGHQLEVVTAVQGG